MGNKTFARKVFLFSLFLTVTTVIACNLSDEHIERMGEILEREYLSKNTLIHTSITEPKGWKLGPENTFQTKSDFPFVRSICDYDYAVFSHPSSRSSIFVSYKPILGISYFCGVPKKLAEWFREAHLKAYKEKGIEVVDGSADLNTREMGDKLFYVIKNEIFTSSKQKRAVYIILHIPDDVKSLYMFCFSTPAKKGIEEEQPFQGFLAMVSGYKAKQLEPYDEALYRNCAKLWMFNYEYSHHMDAKWYKGIVDESIEELKKAATLRPNGWEPHYLLMKEFSSGCFLGYTVVVVEGKPKVLSQIWPFSSQPINADAAIEECKYLVKLNPDFKNRSKWGFEQRREPNLRSVYGTISSMLMELKRYDEAIIYLEEGVKKGPSDLGIEVELEGFYKVRANIKAQKEDYDGAIQDYKSLMALRGYPYNEEIQYEDYRVLAGLYAKKGMKKEALEVYSKALEIVRKGKSFSGITKDNTINGLEARIKELQSQ